MASSASEMLSREWRQCRLSHDEWSGVEWSGVVEASAIDRPWTSPCPRPAGDGDPIPPDNDGHSDPSIATATARPSSHRQPLSTAVSSPPVRRPAVSRRVLRGRFLQHLSIAAPQHGKPCATPHATNTHRRAGGSKGMLRGTPPLP